MYIEMMIDLYLFSGEKKEGGREGGREGSGMKF